MEAGQTFTTTLAGGADGEAIYWGRAEDGGWLVTWASRHQDGFKPGEGPKDASEPFVIYSAGEVAVREATQNRGEPYSSYPSGDEPYATDLRPGHRWVTKDDTRTGVVIELDVDRYVARDEAYNGVPVMAAGHAKRVQQLRDWRAREGRREPQGPGQPQIGAPVKATLPTEALAQIDAAIEQGVYRTRSQAVRRLVVEALAARRSQE